MVSELPFQPRGGSSAGYHPEKNLQEETLDQGGREGLLMPPHSQTLGDTVQTGRRWATSPHQLAPKQALRESSL